MCACRVAVPCAYVAAASKADVVATVRFAVAHKLRVAARGALLVCFVGQGWAPRSARYGLSTWI